ncbi:hybrid sensor histidine kinase/response regulator [Azospirillum agricola]|uniref:hybrid sensor histidine kinase/response regulator n=1 Tax=Azospirillum agricola TaxID=1720247 RepID=UPI000A0F25EB|nr:ATP-binding protein [Azospirillum agricola]SMH45538.1 Signal transduction histidine kinase [Azospirillum lipoferum]
MPLPSIATPKTVLASVIVALGLLGAMAWGAVTVLDYDDTIERAERDSRQAAALLDGHAQAVLEGGSAALVPIVNRIEQAGLARWAESGLDDALAAPGPNSLSILDASGRVVFGPAVTFDGDGFGGLSEGTETSRRRTTLVSAGLAGDERVILLVRRLYRADGSLDGAVLAGVPVAALTPVLNAFGDGLQRSAGLFRPDGTRLSGFGAEALGHLPPLAPGGEAVETDWRIGDAPPAQAGASILGLKRMRDLPVVSAVSVPRATVLAPWNMRLQRGLAVAMTGFLALLGLSWVGLTSLRREAAVRRDLTDSKARLEQRVEERTADLRAVNHKLIRALEEKERANQAKGRFLSAANHDLRQPFQALRLFHHLLMERLKEPRDRSIAEKMGEALDAGEKLLHALLEVATLDAGVVRPEIANVPVAAVLNDVAGEFQTAAAEKGLRLRVMPCALSVRTDRAMLTRMLRDLVRNAVAFTPSGRVTLGCRRHGQWLRIEVWDTGSGIPSEQLDNIFEDFVQLGNPERDRRQGLGLGLAKVRRKAALLGHAVEVRSRFGIGSVFAVSAPVVIPERAPEPAIPEEGGEAPADAERLILVVEDDPVQRSGMLLLLESWGHRVMEAADGEAAVALVRDAEEKPDLIVTDFRLPGRLTGVQVVTRVGELLEQAVPGIILTGDTAPERIREAVATGCRLLHKPFTPDRLRGALAAVIAERSGARAVHRQTAA